MVKIQQLALRSQTGLSARMLEKQSNKKISMRLFCFTYAGGGASVFSSWPAFLPGFVEVCAVELPGREALFLDPPLTRLAPMIDTILFSLKGKLDVPFALFGHSMGALLAFELARALRHHHLAEPTKLFISACRAPHLPNLDPQGAKLPDLEFIAELKRLQGTPTEVLENKELMLLLLPLLRADFSLCENYEYTQEMALDSPIVAFGGLDDPELEYSEVLAWRKHTSGEFNIFMLPGNHFFIHTAKDCMLKVISDELTYLNRIDL